MTNNIQNFKDFTNKFSLTKTLRFELVPHELTRPHINWDAQNAQDIFPADRARNEARPHIKQAIDAVFVEFIADALSHLHLDERRITAFIDLEKESQQSNDTQEIQRKRKEQKDIQQALAKEIGDFFMGRKANPSKCISEQRAFVSERFGGRTVQELLGKELMQILKERYTDDREMLAHIKTFDGFFTGLGDLKLNREHYFSGKLDAGTIANRIVGDNLALFAQNIVSYIRKYRDVSDTLHITDEEKQWFDPRAFNRLFTQEGVDTYNAFIGGVGAEAGDVSGDGFNKRINEYNQRLDKKDRAQRLPLMKKLYQQIGTQRELRFESIDNDAELLALLKDIGQSAPRLHTSAYDFFEWFFDALAENALDMEHIYISKATVRAIAQETLSEWAAFNEVFAGRGSVHKQYTTVSHLKGFIERNGDGWRALCDGAPLTWERFVELWRANTLARVTGGEVRSATAEKVKMEFANLMPLQEAYNTATAQLEQSLIHNERPDEREWSEMVRAWREYLEAYVELARLDRIFRVRINRGKEDLLATMTEEEKDGDFYSRWETFSMLTEELQPQRAFNKIRNYLTKVQSQEKEVRIYFKPQFLGGWSVSQEKNKKGVWLKDNRGNYYLGVLVKNVDFAKFVGDSGEWKKLFLHTLDFKTLFGKGFKNHYNVRFSELSDDDALKFGMKWLKEDKTYYIDTYPALKEIVTKQYRNKKEFVTSVKEALKNSLSMKMEGIDDKILLDAAKKGDVLLFRICNKDLCTKKATSGKKNVHTILFKTLFSSDNLNAFPIKFMLGGSAKIFLRDAAETKREKITTKRNRYTIEKETHTPLHKQRYLDKKLLFHLPVKINATAPEKVTDRDLTTEINNTLLNQPRAVLGIDRGEKHLLYWSLIDADGNLIDSGSLNTINGTDYAALLTQREHERTQARQKWQAVGNITRLKEGYLSHIIHFIVNKALEHNAVIAIEELNFRFMQKRGGQFERSVYLQFQKALLEKLQLIVDKEQAYALEAPQLTSMNMGRTALSLKSLRDQHGIVLFVRPEYTSTTCPHCGWRKDLYINYQSVEKTRSAVADRITSVTYDTQHGVVITYRRENDGSEVVLTSNVDRLKWDTIARKTVSIDADELTNALRAVLGNGAGAGTLPGFSSAIAGMGIPIDSGTNVLDEMLASDDATTWKAFVYYLNTLLQIRNHYRAGGQVDGEGDFLQCPRCGFDTRTENSTLPNGDAVGAYNIARKGRIALEQIRESDKPDVSVKRELWDESVYRKNY